MYSVADMGCFIPEKEWLINRVAKAITTPLSTPTKEYPAFHPPGPHINKYINKYILSHKSFIIDANSLSSFYNFHLFQRGYLLFKHRRPCVHLKLQSIVAILSFNKNGNVAGCGAHHAQPSQHHMDSVSRT